MNILHHYRDTACPRTNIYTKLWDCSCQCFSLKNSNESPKLSEIEIERNCFCRGFFKWLLRVYIPQCTSPLSNSSGLRSYAVTRALWITVWAWNFCWGWTTVTWRDSWPDSTQRKRKYRSWGQLWPTSRGGQVSGGQGMGLGGIMTLCGGMKS